MRIEQASAERRRRYSARARLAAAHHGNVLARESRNRKAT
jgi:hypothetical protein